jgi:hypothetical protein
MIDTKRDKDILKKLKDILDLTLVIPMKLSDMTNIEADSIRITNEKVMREEKNILEMNLSQLIAKIVKSTKEITHQDQSIALMISLEMKGLQDPMTDDFDRYLFIIIMIHHHLSDSWIEFSH